MYIKSEDVCGYYVGKSLICLECIRPDEPKEITAENILTDSEMDYEDFYFCDRCGKRIEKA